MAKNYISKELFDQNNKHLTLYINTDAIIKLKEILSDKKPTGKSFTKIYETYFFLFWMNEKRKYYINREDLSIMIYSKHKDRLRKTLNTLKGYNLCEFDLHFNPKTQRYYYITLTKSFEYDKKSSSVTCIEYDIPERLYNVILGLPDIPYFISNPSNNVVNYSYDNNNSFFPNSPFPLYSGTDSQLSMKEMTFYHQFIKCYDELSFSDNNVYPSPHLSEKDQRLYHKFHQITKYERLSSVIWEGEHVVEVWDAHSSFFIVLGCYLKYIIGYESEEDRAIVNEETNRLLRMALNNELYSKIQEYHNSKSEFPITREQAKKLTQMYKNLSYDYLFKKKKGKIIDGEVKNYWWSKRFKYIDELFRKKFPRIRHYFLSYSRRDELKTVEYTRRDGSKGSKMRYKLVSNLQHEILPYEFVLISMGLCRDLHKKYDVKSITVHDAIYVKESDAKRITSDMIDEMLAERLGVSEKASTSSTCLALF